ncbi:MAG: gliding motility-associated C-terminal domain-containing protein [Bacteroidales bacterium]|nr:gliding motility-associated C-terminal domain-containing protein [Bacteroidales bacterium]
MRNRLLAIIVLAATFVALPSAAQTPWTQQAACPGWNNPTSFTGWTSGSMGAGGYSGSGGRNNSSSCPNVMTGTTGATLLGPEYTASEMNWVGITGQCWQSSLPIPDQYRQFAIMTDLTGTDPNTSNHLKYVPTQFNTSDTGSLFSTNITKSIRIGDGVAGCGSPSSTTYDVSLLNYDMRVTPSNAMLYIYYAIVAQSPTHGQNSNPTFIIRVMKKNAGGQWQQLSDTLAYYISTTPSTVTYGSCPNMDYAQIEPDFNTNGWHQVTPSGSGNVAYKDWSKMAINLSNYLYDTVRVQALIYDCSYQFHYAYAYIAGECGPAQLTVGGCPAEQDTIVTTLQAPRSMVNYAWYASEAGLLSPADRNNPATNWRLLVSGNTEEDYDVKAADFHITRRPDGSTCDSMGIQQTFRCLITSALDPAKPFHTDFYVDVQNTKPVMVVDSMSISNSMLRFWNRSYVPGDPTLVLPDSTQWSIYTVGSSTPYTVLYGDSIDLPIDNTISRILRVRTVTAGAGCTSEAIFYLFPRISTTISCPACPEVRIEQKYDHTPRYSSLGWDTVLDCGNRMLELTSTLCIPVQYFNGIYNVDEIPYNPPDTSFHLDGQGLQIPITFDDRFASPVDIAFPFYFFGIRKTKFRVGDNGLVSFVLDSDYIQDAAAGNDYCPYSYSAPLPWAPGASGAPSHFNRMHDAIYGIYEDTYVGNGGSYLSGNQGIYYGVLGEYPCRKIIASWNGIPVFTNPSLRQSYQIVCYEGSNIIEVHVRHRSCCPSTSGGRGTIGIQNATGQPQVHGAPGTTNYLVQDGAPPAFWPNGANPVTGTLDSVAYRFTPQGTTSYDEHWYRLFDDGRPTVELQNIIANPMAITDTNGYFIPLNSSSTTPAVARAIVEPRSTSRYAYRIRFQNANGDWYDLSDTITVGVDTLNGFTLRQASAGSGEPVDVLTVCQGDTTNLLLEMNRLQDTLHTTWSLTRTDGTTLPSSLIQLGPTTLSGDTKSMHVSINIHGLPGAPAAGIDSIYINCTIDFTNQCSNNRTVLLRIVPASSSDTVANLCDSLAWHGTTYTESTTVAHHVSTGAGCDSIIYLHLTVRHSTDTALHRYITEDQLPYMWNGLTFTSPTSNYIHHSTNAAGCDSTIHFSLTIYYNSDTLVDSTICESMLPLVWNGVTFNTSDPVNNQLLTDSVLLTGSHGADSLVVMRLHLLLNSSSTASDTIVENQLPWSWNGLTFDTADLQPVTPQISTIDSLLLIPNAAGCDSIIGYSLTVYRNRLTSFDTTVCDNMLPLAWRGFTFTHAATHDTVVPTLYGADSTIAFTLVVMPTFDVADTHIVCPSQRYVYEGVDYGGPTAFDTLLLSSWGCDSLVHVVLLPRDTTRHITSLYRTAHSDSTWRPLDTMILGCMPDTVSLRDTTRGATAWQWTVATVFDTTVYTADHAVHTFDDTTHTANLQLVVTTDDGCSDTLACPIHIFRSPLAAFDWNPTVPAIDNPQVTFHNTSWPADSLAWLWYIQLQPGSADFDTSTLFQPTWRWGQPGDNTEGDYDVRLVAIWYQTVAFDTALHHTCTDTAAHTVTITNDFLQFPNLVTPNGDGLNDTWRVVNLLEYGNYPVNELWIFNQWGVEVYHARDISQESHFWDPNATASPDGTYYYRFTARGPYGLVKRNGVIEVLRSHN